jgi:hypothetical protein
MNKYDDLFKFLCKTAQASDVELYFNEIRSYATTAFNDLENFNKIMYEIMTTPVAPVPAVASLNKSAEDPGELRSALLTELETLRGAVIRLEDISKRSIDVIIEFRDALVTPPGNSMMAASAAAAAVTGATQKAVDSLTELMSLASQRRAIEMSMGDIKNADEQDIMRVGPKALQQYKASNAEALDLIQKGTGDLQQLNQMLRAIKRTS